MVAVRASSSMGGAIRDRQLRRGAKLNWNTRLLRLRVRSDDLLKTAAGKIFTLFGLHFAHFAEKLLGPHCVSSLFVHLSKLVDRRLVSGFQPDREFQFACRPIQTVLTIKQFTQKLVRLRYIGIKLNRTLQRRDRLLL